MARPDFEGTGVFHVTLKALPVVGRLRTLDVYGACRIAQRVVAERDGFRLFHYSIQHNHVHLLVEADSKRELTNGVRAFRISMTKRMNRLMSDRRGPVFADRYHSRQVSSPTQMRNALAYVLSNWRHHNEARGRFAELAVDPYSSGAEFLGWAELPVGMRYWPPGEFEPPHLATARTWLARTGWRRAGAISVLTVPGDAPPVGDYPGSH